MTKFHELIEFIRSEVNNSLKNLKIPDKPTYLYSPIRYAIDAKGKRFRPILVHLTGRAGNIESDVIMNISLAGSLKLYCDAIQELYAPVEHITTKSSEFNL